MKAPRHPVFWAAAFLLWFGALWLLSSRAHHGPEMPPIPHIDKILHFGYFFGGGGLLGATLFRLNPANPSWPKIIGFTVLLLALVGGLDEWRQSHVPGRSGNDLGDWIADVLGALCGVLVFKKFHRWLR